MVPFGNTTSAARQCSANTFASKSYCLHFLPFCEGHKLKNFFPRSNTQAWINVPLDIDQLSQDSEVWRVLTTTNVGKWGEGGHEAGWCTQRGVHSKANYPPPPLCNSYALVIATVGVGTVLIWYLILIRYKCSAAA